MLTVEDKGLIAGGFWRQEPIVDSRMRKLRRQQRYSGVCSAIASG